MDKIMIKKGEFGLILIGIFFCLFVLAYSGQVTALSSGNVTFSETDASSCINQSKVILNELISENFSYVRVNDTIRSAEDYFNAQLVLKQKKRTYEFTKVKEYCDEVTTLRKLAFDSRDQVDAFLLFYNNSKIQGMNTSSVDTIVNDINLEMSDERYEQISGLVDKAYTELSNVRSSYTTLNVFYKNTAQGLMVFFLNNWITLTVIVVLLIIFYLVYRIKIIKWIINQKINSLETRKKVVRELIMKAQKDYFQFGILAEGDYNIKTKKFAEIVRDIDRQIPLLREELAKLDHQWRTK